MSTFCFGFALLDWKGRRGNLREKIPIRYCLSLLVIGMLGNKFQMKAFHYGSFGVSDFAGLKTQANL